MACSASRLRDVQVHSALCSQRGVLGVEQLRNYLEVEGRVEVEADTQVVGASWTRQEQGSVLSAYCLLISRAFA